MPPTAAIGPLARTYYKWKALRLPWRKRFFVGYDLQGNTFWEFKLTSAETRFRRIVNYPRSTHYSQVQVSPLWHQWLRHMRAEPPSLEEQSGDVVRQQRMKHLAAEADARWAAKPRVMEDAVTTSALGARGPLPPTNVEATMLESEPDPGAGAGAGARDTEKKQQQRKRKKSAELNDAWAKAKAQGPGENWQPTAWNPSAKR
ncbi:hypothetical protein C2857_006029 [Epichloe festucae Fl1]|uniref:NADH dehydrogenase [ubiquinone] 1 alpha subcomplex subunit n=1 Tax=Epichloe festucae (strain Fl1) TaxID=877507 RepID=A0A7S9KT81_EPIFF|nr:hypothetical protein C2857_006029 [Epichloe festucae Fl1]